MQFASPGNVEELNFPQLNDGIRKKMEGSRGVGLPASSRVLDEHEQAYGELLSSTHKGLQRRRVVRVRQDPASFLGGPLVPTPPGCL